MKRWGFRLIAAAPPVLCILTSALWIRSYRAVDELYGRAWSRWFTVDSFDGLCEVHIELPRMLRPGVNPKLWLYGTSNPFKYVMYSPDPWQPQGSVVCRARWPVEMSDRSDERPLLFPRPQFQTWLAWAKEGPTRYLKVVQVRVPYWFGWVPASVASAVLISKWRRRQWAQRGLCLCCGYDLRATPYRCPECGMASRLAG